MNTHGDWTFLYLRARKMGKSDELAKEIELKLRKKLLQLKLDPEEIWRAYPLK